MQQVTSKRNREAVLPAHEVFHRVRTFWCSLRSSCRSATFAWHLIARENSMGDTSILHVWTSSPKVHLLQPTDLSFVQQMLERPQVLAIALVSFPASGFLGGLRASEDVG